MKKGKKKMKNLSKALNI
jgi:hypothetical protein